ncbi:MAG: DUF1896 family protein [Flavisolibacter sp.]|nr:DUF1896 family protein [Flavisolibacter sp.]
MMELEQSGTLSNYLADKIDGVQDVLNQYINEPLYLLEERCMHLLTNDLRPSKYNYICRVLEEEFSTTHARLKQSGVLKFEAINLISHCIPVFEAMHFNEANEENRFLYYAIAGAISEYFDKEVSEKEIVSHGLQQLSETAG